MSGDCNYGCSICSYCCVAFSMFFIIPSAVIFAVTTHRELYVVARWNESIISKPWSPQLIPFDPLGCPRYEPFSSQPFLTYFEALAPENSSISVTLKDDISTAHVIGSCDVNANDVCRIPFGSLENVFPYIILKSPDVADEVVQWGCSYFNLPFLLSAIILSCCVSVCLVCCCNACLCCTLYCCCKPTEQQHPQQQQQQQQQQKRQPQRKRQQRQQLRPKYNTLPTELETHGDTLTQPLLLNVRTETKIENGIAIRKEISTLQKVRPDGRVEMYENVRVFVTDGNDAVVAEGSKGLILN